MKGPLKWKHLAILFPITTWAASAVQRRSQHQQPDCSRQVVCIVASLEIAALSWKQVRVQRIGNFSQSASRLHFTSDVQEVKQERRRGKMSKLLKHLGIGGKKAPPHPPKPDYSSSKSQSFDSSLTRSPTSEKSCTGLSTTSSQISGFEVAQLQGSPHKVGDKGARPKDSGGISPHALLQGRASAPVLSGGEEIESPTGEEAGGAQGATGPAPSATPVSQVLTRKRERLSKTRWCVFITL